MKKQNGFQKIVRKGAMTGGKPLFNPSSQFLKLAKAEFFFNGGKITLLLPGQESTSDKKQREDVEGFFNDQDLSGLI